MKNIALLMFCSFLFMACNKKEAIQMKEGVSLPPVENLTITKGAGNAASLTWDIPTGIPPEIDQPLSVQVELKSVNGLRTNVMNSIILPNAPTDYEMNVPDASATYYITVKLNGRVKNPDPDYSSNIFSLGKTARYN